MANILTPTEAATVLRTAEDDQNMLDLLPLVDAYIKNATGRDWVADDPVRPEAKSAARMLLVRWHEDPGGMAAGAALGFGLSAALVQLEALALTLETEDVPDEALAIAASFPAEGASEISVSANLVLIFNHEMASGAENNVSLQEAGGSPVTSANSLDVTGKILTVNPDTDLQAASSYRIVIDGVADVYGQTLTEEISFTTA